VQREALEFFEADQLMPLWRRTRPRYLFYTRDSKSVPIPSGSVDLIVTSPPYWKKRDYRVKGQIGQEETPEEYAANIGAVLAECHRVLAAHGNLFLNIGDSYHKRSLAGVPSLVEMEARRQGFQLRNRIVWAKRNGMPDPAQDRLANRHEYILHLTRNGYYYDLYGYSRTFGNGANPGDVWRIDVLPSKGAHLAPYPEEIVRRAIVAACPPLVNRESGEPVRRVIARTMSLDRSRPQARRAMELAQEHGLSSEHIRAVQSVGITDAGKAREIQTGVDKNTASVMRLAAEAKEVLGGYFREFTFAQKATKGWLFDADAPHRRGVVYDPFLGTGTTLRVARQFNLSGLGVDLKKWQELDHLAWLRGK
jgi:DNA modification methylase